MENRFFTIDFLTQCGIVILINQQGLIIYLQERIKMLNFSGEHLNEISFPLGGIGTGSVGLAGNGRLIDWEIFNRPNK